VTIARITERSMSMNALANLQTDLSNLAITQSQLSSGRIINKPSDDPAGTAVDLATRAALARTNQYTRNTQDGLGWLGTADSSLSDVVTSLQRARTLLVQSQNGTSDATSQQAISTEVASLRDEVLSDANSTYNNQPIFAGTAGVTAAYSASGTYKGDNNSVQRQVSDTSRLTVAMPGSQVFGTPGADVFALLQKASTDVSSNPSGVAADITALDGFLTGIENAQTQVGTNYNRVQDAQTEAATQINNLTDQKSQVEDADTAQTEITLQLQQTSYQAALSATAKALQPSLLQFLT
jgi:flagellar hook-associated protein 3 FlgL